MTPLLLFSKPLTAPFTSDCLEQILNQLSKAIILAANSNRFRQYRHIPHALESLAELETRPLRLTEIAYGWCSTIYANREKLGHWEIPLLACLKLGFRHLDPRQQNLGVTLTHTEHHRVLVDVVFWSRNSEAIADLLQAWTTKVSLFEYPDEMLGLCTGRLIGRRDLVPFSPRLRRLVIRFVEIVGYEGFEGAGVEKLIELLDHLHVTAEEMDDEYRWTSLLLGVIQSSEGAQRLSDWYWKFLVRHARSEGCSQGFGERLLGFEESLPEFEDIIFREIAYSLADAQQWGKLECWIGIQWTIFKSDGIFKKSHKNSTRLLSDHQPGIAQRLMQWLEQWSQRREPKDIPESFQRILTRAHETVQNFQRPFMM